MAEIADAIPGHCYASLIFLLQNCLHCRQFSGYSRNLIFYYTGIFLIKNFIIQRQCVKKMIFLTKMAILTICQKDHFSNELIALNLAMN